MDEMKVIKALAHPVRRNILRWLKEPARYFGELRYPLDIGVAAGDFRLAGLAQSTMSAHLVTLSGAELIIANKVGQWIFYRRNELTIQLFVRQLEVDL